MLNVAVLVSGGGTNLQAILDAIRDGKITDTKIVRVISSNPKAYALERAANAGIETSVVRTRDFDDRASYAAKLLETIKESGAQLIVLAGFMVQIPPELIRAYPNAIINVHPALIPSFAGKGFYGLHVHEAALARGVKVTGATVHFVNEELDEGPIIAQKAVEIREDDTPESLQLRVMQQAEWKLLPQAVDDIAHGRLTVENGRVIYSDHR